MIDRLYAITVLMLYFGLGAVVGSFVLFLCGNVDVGMAIGAVLMVVAGFMYGVCLFKSMKGKREL